MRVGRGGFILAGALAVAVASAGCGSGGPSRADYDRQLNALCADEESFTRNLPTMQREQALTIDDLRARADAHAATFRSDVARLAPPDNLAADHQKLIAALNHPPQGSTDPAALTRYARSLRWLYANLTAARCVTSEDDALAALAGLPH